MTAAKEEKTWTPEQQHIFRERLLEAAPTEINRIKPTATQPPQADAFGKICALRERHVAELAEMEARIKWMHGMLEGIDLAIAELDKGMAA